MCVWMKILSIANLKKRKKNGLRISHFASVYWSFSSGIMAVKGLTGNSCRRNTWSDRAGDAPWGFTQKLKPRAIFIDTMPCCATIKYSIRDHKDAHGKGYTFHRYVSCSMLHLSLNLMLSNEKCWRLSPDWCRSRCDIGEIRNQRR